MGRRIRSNKAKYGRPLDKKSPEMLKDSLVKWVFHNVDRDGKFSFDPSREDFDAEKFLRKLLDFSTMTWQQISNATHDRGKSKHHYLDEKTLSAEAVARIEAKRLEEYTDAIFSFAIENKLRVIGIRDGSEFQVIWYDACHEFCPSTRT